MYLNHKTFLNKLFKAQKKLDEHIEQAYFEKNEIINSDDTDQILYHSNI